MKKILGSKIISISLGLILIGYGVYDLYEELLQPSHEHVLIVIGFLMVVNAIGDAQEGIHKIAHAVKEDKEFPILDRIKRFFRHPVVIMILGLTVIITSIYGLYEDIEKIHSKSVSMAVGLIIMTLPMLNVYIGGKNLSKGIRGERSK